jgi:ribosomal protein S18 acetylase RimI-like enzyme
LKVGEQPAGYAILIAFWSNELGGEVCHVDELFVTRDLRGRGHGRELFTAITSGDLWPSPIVAIALGVTPDNARARRLYEQLGFATVGASMVLRVPPP